MLSTLAQSVTAYHPIYTLQNLDALSDINDQITKFMKIQDTVKADIKKKQCLLDPSKCDKAYVPQTHTTTGNDKQTLEQVNSQIKKLMEKQQELKCKANPNNCGTGQERTPIGEKKNFHRELSTTEAMCYWMNYPKVAKEYFTEKIPLTTATAAYSWNDHANKSKSNWQRDCHCWKDQNTGKYDRKMNQNEANCYWTKFPMVALDFQQKELPLDITSAEWSWNYMANKGKVREFEC